MIDRVTIVGLLYLFGSLICPPEREKLGYYGKGTAKFVVETVILQKRIL